ncbi:MAG: acyl carrier protein [Acidobacteriota bacterium]
MQITKDQLRRELLGIFAQLRDDWNYSIPVTEDTGIFRDLGFESIDAVALGSRLEEQFDRSLPFARFLTTVREQKLPDITVGLLLDFLLENLNAAPAGRAS